MRYHLIPPFKIGKQRQITRFAFWPRRIGSTWIWLERYKVTQRFDGSRWVAVSSDLG